MTLERGASGSGDRPDSVIVDLWNEHGGDSSCRLVTDGGQAQMEDPDDEKAEEPGDETEETEETEAEDEEAAEEAEAAESHVEDAEEVYQSEDASGVAHLDLDGLFLDVLGLEVNLNEVTLDVSARPGENNLLGNLLSAVSGLLDGPGALFEKVKSLLGNATDRVRGLLERPKQLLSQLITKPREILGGLFGFGSEVTDEEAEADEETEAESEDGGGIRGRLSSAVGWLKSKLAGLIPGLPVEELVATIVREVVQTVIDRLEPDRVPQQEQPQAEASA